MLVPPPTPLPPPQPAPSIITSPSVSQPPGPAAPSAKVPPLMAQAQPLILTQTANGTFLLPAPTGGGGGPSILLTAQVHITTMHQWVFFVVVVILNG